MALPDEICTRPSFVGIVASTGRVDMDSVLCLSRTSFLSSYSLFCCEPMSICVIMDRSTFWISDSISAICLFARSNCRNNIFWPKIMNVAFCYFGSSFAIRYTFSLLGWPSFWLILWRWSGLWWRERLWEGLYVSLHNNVVCKPRPAHFLSFSWGHNREGTISWRGCTCTHLIMLLLWRPWWL